MMPRMSRFARFFRGAGFLFRGFALLFSCPRAGVLALVPLVTSLVAFLAIGALGVWLAGHYGGRLAGGGWGTLWAWTAGVLAFLAFLVAGFFTFGMIASLAAAPFNGLLSEAVEKHLTGGTGEVRDRGPAAEVLRSGVSAGKLFALEFGVMIPALVLLLVPIVGALVYAAMAGFFLALNYLDSPLDRRKLGLRRKLAFCGEHRAEVMGFGVLVYLAMLVPLVNLLAVPAAAAGATGLFVALNGKPENEGAPAK